MAYRCQFSLKWLFVATTVAAIIVAAVRWHANRLPVLANKFNALLHQRRYRDADALALKARQLYPDELLPRHMENLCGLILHKKKRPALGWHFYPLRYRLLP